MLPISIDAGESKEIYVYHSKDGQRRSLLNAVITVTAALSADAAPIFTKTIGGGIVIAGDNLSALCTIGPADTTAAQRGTYVLIVEIKWMSGQTVTERYTTKETLIVN